MRWIAVFLALCGSLDAQERQPIPQPTQFEIGRRIFFDIGPPFNYYDILTVRPTPDGTSVERITLTPPADRCTAPATIETAAAVIAESGAALLGSSTNPCAIPEKALRRELKRCKNCLVFSGADVIMRVQCGGQTRLIRSAILDKDMFDSMPRTPEHTSWTMRLLERLEANLGPGVMGKPIFTLTEVDHPRPERPSSPALVDLAAGKFDDLFKGAPDKPSELYHFAQNSAPAPAVRLVSSIPMLPETIVLPEYPPLARAAHIEGSVAFMLDIDSNGDIAKLAIQSGHPLLHQAVRDGVSTWKFPAAGQFQVTIAFSLNCASPK